MASERDNQVHRCKRANCHRATFVETEEGISAHFHHGSGKPHKEVFTFDQIRAYLAARGFVVIEVSRFVKAA
jgi:hypothetical protein